MSLATTGIDCMISLPFSGAMEMGDWGHIFETS